MLEEEGQPDGFQSHTPSRYVLRSHSPSRRASSALSKIYKAASTLYLTRRLPEALQTIEPLISVTKPASDEEEVAALPPIASANRSLRVKVWNFYLTLLNAIIELGPEDGKNEFGSTVWRAIVAKVRDGSIWEEVVQAGYGGSEGSVDADVVANLSTLLLAQSQSQALNQSRLETYLSFSSSPELALADRLNGFEAREPGYGMQRRPSQASGTNTPRDLNSRAKVLELYTLHVLPRNEEWETAREFIRMSNELDDERKDAFLYTLDTLQEQAQTDRNREAELLRQRDEELARQRQEAEDRRLAESRMLEEKSRASEAASQKSASSRGGSSLKGHQKSNSEVDYGIEETRTPKTARIKREGSSTSSRPKTSQSSSSKNTSRTPGRARKQPPRATALQRIPAILGMMQRMLTNVAQTMAKDRLALVRNLLFLLAFIIAFARRDVRERIARITGTGWGKIAGTIGMGTKVSYI